MQGTSTATTVMPVRAYMQAGCEGEEPGGRGSLKGRTRRGESLERRWPLGRYESSVAWWPVGRRPNVQDKTTQQEGYLGGARQANKATQTV